MFCIIPYIHHSNSQYHFMTKSNPGFKTNYFYFYIILLNNLNF